MTTGLKKRIFSVKSKSSFQYIFLSIIILIAAALRFYKLGEWSFWWDEMFTLRDSEAPFQNEFFPPPALTFVLIYLARLVLGTSEWSTRLVPALIGVISIPALFFPIRKIFGSSAALLTIMLLAISPWHLYWSQNARFYVTMLLFYTLALFAFYFWLEKDRLAYLLLSILLLTLAINERLTAFIFVPVVGSYVLLLLILPFKKPRGLNLRNVSLLVIPGLILVVFFSWNFIQNPSLWLKIFGWVNNNPFWILAGVAYYIGVATICIAAFGAIYLLSRWDRAGLLFSLGAIIPLIAILGLSLIQYTANRYVFIALTSWIILAGVGAKELIAQSPRQTKILALSVVAILLFVPLSEDILYYRYQNGNRDDWKTAFTYVEQHKNAKDIVVASNASIGRYYLSAAPLAMEQVDLTELEEGNARVWIVADMNVEPKWPHIHQWLQQNARLMAEFDVHVQARTYRMRVYLYDPQLPTAVERVSQQKRP